MNFIIFMCMETEEQKKIDIVLDKYLEDKQSYEETIERMTNEDYQRWLGLIRPEYMDRYIQYHVCDALKNKLKIGLDCDEIGLLNVSVKFGDKIIASDTFDLLPVIGRISDESKR